MVEWLDAEEDDFWMDMTADWCARCVRHLAVDPLSTSAHSKVGTINVTSVLIRVVVALLCPFGLSALPNSNKDNGPSESSCPHGLL